MRFSKTDFAPMLADAGLDETILTAFHSTIQLDALTVAVNTATGLDLSESDVVFYIGERGGLDLTVTGGTLKPPTPRLAAPTGLASDASGVWFDEPATGTVMVRWYVNGALAAEEERDLATNRYMALATLGAVPSDVVQIALVESDVCGWWARTTV